MSDGGDMVPGVHGGVLLDGWIEGRGRSGTRWYRSGRWSRLGEEQGTRLGAPLDPDRGREELRS